jgi:hypothetical protein
MERARSAERRGASQTSTPDRRPATERWHVLERDPHAPASRHARARGCSCRRERGTIRRRAKRGERVELSRSGSERRRAGHRAGPVHAVLVHRVVRRRGRGLVRAASAGRASNAVLSVQRPSPSTSVTTKRRLIRRSLSSTPSALYARSCAAVAGHDGSERKRRGARAP